MSRLSYTEARRALASAQKAGAGVPAYLRWVNRPLGGKAAVVGATWGATPNGVTALSAVIGLAGVGVLAAVTDWWAGPLAAVLLLVGYVLDSADGQLARIQGRGGPAGEWLDHVVDGVRAPLVHISVAIHLLRTDATPWLILCAGLFSVLVSGWFLSQLLAEKLLPKPVPSSDDGRRGILESFIKQPQDPSTTYVVVAFVGLPMVFTVLYAALFAWHILIFAGSLRRKYSQLTAL
ncbi:CDP-alcohol phosphatidyltransferase family protein [Microbacterium sp. KSW4-16]|uniref:CDP-alcohol phosphatidyltransferase family protein n=1 Tax=Microbacterium TaxID=33882 RepID=UPI0011BB0FFD|nr:MULTISPECIES: CDP-alcohol phosphatidyltransferase family protein [Microbacterium]MCK8467171.1 CDP-alcohol phosphatidyltransferase family protein [Microbacterium aurugineum]QEA28424.1 CDP-alcohol phosphatidyltransferase family protein [Microbacterium sp. CBA3102]